MPHPYLQHPDLDPGWPIAFAHRGGHDVAPENTMASFEHAVSIGYRYLETDVHLTLDGALVSFHDEDLKRTCGIDARIGEMTAAEVAEARVDGEHPIPLMADLLEAFPTARFNIDAKNDVAVEPLCDLVRAFDALDRVCLAAFELKRLKVMRSVLGTGLITNMSPVEIGTLLWTGRVFGAAHRIAQVPTSLGRLNIVNRRFISNAKQRGIAVNVWTINDRAEAERLVDLGVDGLMTDDTQMLRDLFVERGHWPT